MRRLPTLLLALTLYGLPAMSPGAESSLLDLLRGKQQASEFLTAEEAFRLSAHTTGPTAIHARWSVQPGHYLYRDKLRFELSGTDARIIATEFPASEPKHDEYFGQVEIYHDTVSVRLRLDRPLKASATLIAHYQGCAERGICYPPMTATAPLTPLAEQ